MAVALILIVVVLTIAAMFVVPYYARDLARRDALKHGRDPDETR